MSALNYIALTNSEGRSKTGEGREFYKYCKTDTKHTLNSIQMVAPKRERVKAPITMSDFTRNNLLNKFKRSLQNGGLSRIIKNIETGVENEY